MIAGPAAFVGEASAASGDVASAADVQTNDASSMTADLAQEDTSTADPDFRKSTLQGFSATNPTALEWGPDDRLYVSTQRGTLYALDVERTGENSYQVTEEVQIDAIKDIPNHLDTGDYDPSDGDRQITGLTVGGTAAEPVLYVSSSDSDIDVNEVDDDTDTNSGAISRLTLDWSSDGSSITNIDHDVMVIGLPRSSENHAPNGLDLSSDGDTLYVAQGGNTNKGAPDNNFGFTPEYALSAAVLEIDLAQINADYDEKNFQDYDPQGSSQSYPDLTFLYAIPTIETDDGTDGDDLPFGGERGENMAKLVEGGPVQIYSPGYRNPYDVVLAESGKLYVSDHGPNGGWGGQPADANGDIVSDASSVTNHPNEDGGFQKQDEFIQVDEGTYGGHPAPIRANPTGADIYDQNGDVVLDITSSNSPVPQSLVNPDEADYIPPTSGSPDPGAPAGSANTMETTGGQKVLFDPTGGTDEYTASNFGGAMQGDILQVELNGDVERVELSADGETATNVETIFNTGGPLGIATIGDDGAFPGTVWTANRGPGDVTVFEPVDYDGASGGGDCAGTDDASLDEDGDGYDNADELDAGTDPCSAASTPADFDDDGTSNLNDPDDDNDGLDDTEDPFAVDADNGVDTTLPVQYDLSELSLFGESGQGWTGLMTNGQDDYQDLYDPTKMTVGGAAEVLTVESVPTGDAINDDQQYAFQFGVDAPDEPFTVSTTVSGYPSDPANYHGLGVYVGNGDQDNYAKLVVSANGGTGGLEFAKETGGSFSSMARLDDSTVKGPSTSTDLYLTVDPTTDPNPNNGQDEVEVTAEYAVDGGQRTEVATGAIPASWLDSSDGTGLAVGVISTSYEAGSPFAATWSDISVERVSDDTGDMTVAEAVASQNAPADEIDRSEIQTAINWWATDAEVPGTAGETISRSELQSLINAWATDATVGDGGGNQAPSIQAISDRTVTEGDSAQVSVSASDADGDSLTLSKTSGPSFVTLTDDGDGTGALDITPGSGDAGTYTVEVTAADGNGGTATESFQLTVEETTTGTGSAEITVNANSDNIDVSTYGQGSFEITNTGDQPITSVTFDVSESLVPDAVFDPDGKAGDETAKPLSIDSESGDGVGVVSTADDDVFSQPHNGQDDTEGYDRMTIEFDDFEPGESVSFSIDLDPTTIKGVSGAGGAGSISGLELTASDVSVGYADGATQQTDLFGDGSDGGAQATVDSDVEPAPTLGVEGVSLQSTDFPAHEAAAVDSQQQTLTLSGAAGTTVRLIEIEGSLPPSDGYDLDEFEADSAESVSYRTVTLDSNGQATVQVSLSESNPNYFVAVGEASDGDTGRTSGTVILEYDSGSN